jgi:hypothetical protein
MQISSQQCINAPMGLAVDIDDGDQRPLHTATNGSDCSMHIVGHRPGLIEPDLTKSNSGKRL